MKKDFLAIVFFWVVLAVYLLMMAPGICADDSGELCGVAATLGVTHSPGYPLFALAGKMFNFLFPLATAAYRTNLIAVVFAAAGQAVIFRLLLDYSLSAAFFSGIFLLTNYFLINISTVTEVYGVAIFFVALIIWQIMRCFQEEFRRPVRVVLIIYLWILAIVSHYTTFLLFPVIGYLLWRTSFWKQRKFLAVMIFFILVAGSIVFFIYIRARNNPVFSWEDPKTLKRFIGVVGRWRYGSVNLAQGGPIVLSVPVIREKLKFFGQLLIQANGTLAFVLALFLSIAGWRKGNPYRRAFGLFFGGFLFTGLGFLLAANVSIGKYSAELLARFFFLPMLLLSIAFGLAIAGSAGVRRLGVIFLIILVISSYKNISADNRQDFIYYDYARNILATLPPQTILFSDRADEMEFCLAYLLWVEKKRPDITFIDCNAGVSKSIYGDDYYYIWGRKRLQIRTEVEKEWLKKYSSLRPVYYATFFPEMIGIKRYPAGLIFATKPPEEFPCSEIYIYRYPKKNLDFRHAALNSSYFQLLLDDALARKDILNAEIFSRGLLAYSQQSDVILSVAWRFFSAGDILTAERYFLRALNAGIQPAIAANNLGVIYKQQGKKSLARDYYEKSLALDNNYAQAYYNLAVLAWEENNWTEVINNLEKVVRLEPENSAARKYLQQAKLRLGEKK